MKVLVLLIAGIAMAGSSYAANPYENLTASPRARAIIASKSIMYRQPAATAPAAEYDKCRTYKRMQTAGIVLLATGVPTMVTGGVMMHVGARGGVVINTTGDGRPNTVRRYSADNPGLIAAGAVFTTLGVAMTASGTALTIAGSVKKHKYCGSASPRAFYISPSNSGTGIAATF